MKDRRIEERVNPQLSIVVPIYNVESYLEKCIESILAQTFTNYELILINDGSTDKSLNICKKYQKIDSRIKVIDKKNGGVSSARNEGLSIATGEWIGFVDADDYIDLDFYSCLMEKNTIANVDIICCGVKAVDNNGEEREHIHYSSIPQRELYLTKEEALTHFLNPERRYLYWSPWDKIIRSNIAREFKFEVGRKYAEDFYYCTQCILRSRGIYYIPDKKYNYLLRTDSAVRSRRFDESMFDGIYFAKKAYERTSGLNKEIKLYAEMNLVIVAARTIRLYYQLKDKRSMKYRDEIRNLQRIIKTADFKVKKQLTLAHRLLLIEAVYLPNMFKIR